MAKTYKGSLTLEWYNKQKSILLQASTDAQPADLPAPKINWINKEEALFYEIDETEGTGQTPFWVDRNDIRVKEARPLILQSVFKAVEESKPGTLSGMDYAWKIVESKEDDQSVENILIRGDNLLVLNTLKKMFDNKQESNKVKLILIDPPYNTKKAFQNYDDNLEHSEWLSLMRDRLILLWQILSDDGVIAVHIDDKEQAYLKILLDEIFGRENFLATFIWETDGNSDNQARIIELHEYIHVYAKNEELIEYPSVIDPNIPEKSKIYRDTIQNTIVKNGPKNPISGVKLPVGFPAQFEEGIIRTRDVVFPRYNQDLIIKNGTLTNEVIAESGWSSKDILLEFINNGLVEVVDSKNQKTVFSLKLTGAIESIKTRNKSFGYVITPLRNLGNTQSTAKEIFNQYGLKTDFPKPEPLISYLTKIFTETGDYVLDCFAGSGTTPAVCQKINRKWIAVEIGNHADTHIIKRLKGVISGDDKIGISAAINWAGGGSFKYYHLGESIIKTEVNGQGDFNWSMGRQHIEANFLFTYDYQLVTDFQPSQVGELPAIGIQRVGNDTRVAIISLCGPEERGREMLGEDELMSLYKAVSEQYKPRYINVFTNRGVELAYDAKPSDLEVIKVPHAIFSELEK